MKACCGDLHRPLHAFLPVQFPKIRYLVFRGAGVCRLRLCIVELPGILIKFKILQHVLQASDTNDIHIPHDSPLRCICLGQYALFYPDRRPADARRERADFYKLKKLDFDEPDTETFTALPLAIKVGRAGGILPTVYNAANEEAVAAFLAGKTGFLDIAELIAGAVDHSTNVADPDVDRILDAEKAAREYVRSRIDR